MSSVSKGVRPWGYWEVLFNGQGFKVKKIHVKPGHRLSLQSHEKRSEHWIVTRGTATITVGQNTRDVHQDQSTYIAVGQKHRLENKQKVDLELVEVQLGPYLEEDDIVRYEDDYERT